jgi:protein SCO1/2
MDPRRLIAILTGLVLAIAVGWGAYSLVGVFEAERPGVGQVSIGGPFSLVDHTGERVSEADFKGRHMLLYFGYTFCPDVCPTELQAMSEALDALGPDAARVQPVFISIDPERDTPEVLADYRQHFHDDFRMLTGTPAEVRAAAKVFRIFFTKVDDGGSDDYLMDHSSVVYLLDEAGRYVAHFGPNTAPDEMARRIREAI